MAGTVMKQIYIQQKIKIIKILTFWKL